MNAALAPYRAALGELGFAVVWHQCPPDLLRERHELTATGGRVWVFLDASPGRLDWSVGYDSPGASDTVSYGSGCFSRFLQAVQELVKTPAHRLFPEPQ